MSTFGWMFITSIGSSLQPVLAKYWWNLVEYVQVFWNSLSIFMRTNISFLCKMVLGIGFALFYHLISINHKYMIYGEIYLTLNRSFVYKSLFLETLCKDYPFLCLSLVGTNLYDLSTTTELSTFFFKKQFQTEVLIFIIFTPNLNLESIPWRRISILYFSALICVPDENNAFKIVH